MSKAVVYRTLRHGLLDTGNNLIHYSECERTGLYGNRRDQQSARSNGKPD